MVKYVKSITDYCEYYGIKNGDVCKVVREAGPGTAIHTYTFDRAYGGYRTFQAYPYFEPIACPCNIRNCLKHRQ